VSGRGLRRLLWLTALIGAACLDLRAERLPIKIYTTADGLAHNDVNRIVKDSRGFLWFCTAGGLSRFDGYAFTNFSTEQGLPNSNVNDLLETRGGDYWVATAGGLVRFDPKGRPGRRAAHPSDDTPAPMFTVVPDDGDQRARIITVLREGRDGTIWVGTHNGLYRLELANGRRSLRPVDVHIPHEYPEQRFVVDVVDDARGRLWISAHGGLYRRWPDGSAARYTMRDGLPDFYPSDLLEDHEGRIWVGSRSGGFFRISADDSDRALVVDLRFSAPELPTAWVFQLFETSDRRFWVATDRGLVEFLRTGTEQGPRFRTYSERSGLSYFDITAVNEDLGGNLWLGTNTAGAMKLTRDGFVTYGAQDGIRVVTAIFEDRAGNVCFRGSVLGDARTSVFEGAKLELLSPQQPVFHTRLGCFNGQRFDWFTPAAVTKMGWVQEHITRQARNGEWWVGTGEGLYRFPAADHFSAVKTARPLNVYTTKDGLASRQVFRLFEDSRGNMWISTTAQTGVGLGRWESASERVLDLSHSPELSSVKDDVPRSFGEDQAGNVWIGFNHGLARYAHGRFRLFTESEGLPPGTIMNIHVDRSGRLWLASEESGLVRVDHAGAERPAFVSYTTSQGLSSNNTEVITEDDLGNIYVGGARGLDRLDPSTGRVKHFTVADGLAPGLFRAALRDRHGVLWFGMTSGLARLAPVAETPPAPPPVLISGVRVSGVPQFVSALGEQETALPDLAPGRGQLQIDFLALGFAPGEVLRYQYRLDGADADWSELGEQRTVTYAGLGPGRYRFTVRAVNSDGIASDHPAVITFTVLRPVWLRWWFVALSVIAVGLMVRAVYRYRVARLLEIANMRTRIATDLHDDIGANLTRIALLSEVASQTPGADPGDLADGPLSSIAQIARESVSSMSDIVWAINPKRESLLDLTRRMRQHAEEVFTLRDIDLRFNGPSAADSLKLGMNVRRDLLLIFKEAVNNCARHSRCERVEIDLRIEGPRLVLTVVDHGVGFDPSKQSDGQGLRSMERRAHRLNGSLGITAGPGGGTAITLNIPIRPT
jgi:ligand-binding sensor domain-containing protein/two-component sensor histidine kinase